MAIVRLQDTCGNWVIINTAVNVTASDIGLGNVQDDLAYLTNRKARKSTDSADDKGYRIGNVVIGSNLALDPNTGLLDLTQVPVALLDGIISADNLPSYVDDIVEGYYYNNVFYKEAAHTTVITGETGKIYLDITDANTPEAYRWSGSVYVKISGGGSYILPPATTSTLGGVKPDGTTITVDNDGTIHSAGSGTPAWTDVTNKPFSTIGAGLTVTSDTLKVDIDSALSTTSENPVQNKVIANAGFLTSVPAATVSDFGGFKLVTYTQSFTANDWTSASSLAALNVSLATNYSDTNLIYLNSKVSIPGDNSTHYGDDYTLLNINAEYSAVYTLNVVEDTSAHTLTAQFTTEAGNEFAGTITAQFLSLA